MRDLIARIQQEISEYKTHQYFGALQALQTHDLTHLKKIKIAVLRSYSAESLQVILTVQLILLGYLPEFQWGDYNQYAQEILDTKGPLYKFAPDLILILVRQEELLPDFTIHFSDLAPIEWKGKISESAVYFSHLLSALAKSINASIVVQNFALVGQPYFGIYDAQQPVNQHYLVTQLNFEIGSMVKDLYNIYFWDFNNFVQRMGWQQLYDPKLDFFAHNPFSPLAYIEIGNDLLRYVSSVLGNQKKCIVLDLDNTLWSGVIGEDGLAGIKLGQEYPGNCYRAFQEALLKLTQRGIVLSLNSKNNEADVNEVFTNHPDMLIKKQHIVAQRVNWQDKVTNMREIANELNIGLDSLIFIDDNPAECELVRRELPGVSVILLPSKPYLIPDIVDQLPFVENIRITKEDQQKSGMYRAQAARSSLEQKATNLADFLAALKINVTIAECDSFTLPRIAQLTQKTNQFNLTTRRYTEAELTQLINSELYRVFSVAATDRFGDHGLIGVFILRFVDQNCEIDNLLLSCRVISRTIEQSMLAYIITLAENNNCQSVIGYYYPTTKNKQVSDFYPKFGFEQINENEYRFVLNSSQKLAASPYIQMK
jgi:FkbH-like protein